MRAEARQAAKFMLSSFAELDSACLLCSFKWHRTIISGGGSGGASFGRHRRASVRGPAPKIFCEMKCQTSLPTTGPCRSERPIGGSPGARASAVCILCHRAGAAESRTIMMICETGPAQSDRDSGPVLNIWRHRGGRRRRRCAHQLSNAYFAATGWPIRAPKNNII